MKIIANLTLSIVLIAIALRLTIQIEYLVYGRGYSPLDAAIVALSLVQLATVLLLIIPLYYLSDSVQDMLEQRSRNKEWRGSNNWDVPIQGQ